MGMNVPYGYCHCGCGLKTRIAKTNRKSLGIKAGEPNPYWFGHGSARSRFDADGNLFCTNCEAYKHPDCFTVFKRNRTGKALNCRECAKEKRKQYEPEHRKRCAAYALKWQYGLSVEQYDALLERQNYVCAICSQPETYRRKGWPIRPLSVDHDHDTGAVRGLLCQACNFGLGSFMDDTCRLGQAIAYLERHKADPSLNLGDVRTVTEDIANGIHFNGTQRILHRIGKSGIRDIKRRHASGNVTMASLAREYGISNGSVSYIIRGKLYADIV